VKDDSLGDRMKAAYENRTRFELPRRTYTVIRIDGKAFHTFTRGCERPFDFQLMQAMDETALALCREVQGARLAFVQSDEISLVLTDFDTTTSEGWFDGGVQKIASVSASLATSAFNRVWLKHHLQVLALPYDSYRWASFDSRVFTIPDRAEVCNYLIWRQQDATRNSIQMAAQACFPPDEVQKRSGNALQEKLFQERGINWNDYPVGAKRGRTAVQRETLRDVEYVDGRTGEPNVARDVRRRHWAIEEPPVFARDRAWLEAFIPLHPAARAEPEAAKRSNPIPADQ
jgi:tRNA(His) guanylyltransferase